MSTELGGAGSIPSDLHSGIIIPNNQAPERVLRKDEKIELLQSGQTGGVVSYKFLASSSDTVPGFLSDKINGSFSIVANKLSLVNFGILTTDDLIEGSSNFYLTQSISDTIDLNTASRHNHTNKTLLDSIIEGNLINGATSPIVNSNGILSHNNDDGNKHVPSNIDANQYDILYSGINTGEYFWGSLSSLLANVSLFEATPSIATDKGVQSNWINDHNLNNLTDVNHLNDSQLNYLTTNIPNHINSSILHVPSPIGNNGKFLTTNGSVLSWGDGGLITLAGENYLSLTGSTLTAGKIALSNVSFTAGTNISLDTTLNTISAIQRGISDSPINSDSITGISAGWAYNHVNSFGNSGHVPLAGTIGHFLSWDGTYKDINQYVANPEVLDYAMAMQEDATLDPGLAPSTGDRYIILNSSNLNSNFGVISGVENNDIVEFNGTIFEVSFDASAATSSVQVVVTLDKNGNPDREWYYSVTGGEWRDRGVSASSYWTRNPAGILSPLNTVDSISLANGSGLIWNTGGTIISGDASSINFSIGAALGLTITGSNIIAGLPISTDSIVEKTASNGVNIDGNLLKDSEIVSNIFNLKSSATRIERDGSGNLLFTDGISGSKTLASLINTVDSVNGHTGTVVLNTDDITEGSANLYNRFPAGGSEGYELTKDSSTNYDATWKPLQQTLISSSAIAMNVANGKNAILSLAHTGTLTLSNLTIGIEGNIIIDNTGTYNLTISPTPMVINGGNGGFVLTSNSRTILSYYYDGTDLNITYGPNYT